MLKKQDTAKALPHSEVAEVGVLGSVILDPGKLEEIRWLRAGDFFSIAHGAIYSAMLDMREASMAIDLLTLHERLRETNQLERAGGAIYVAKLADGISRKQNIVEYAKMVYDCSMRRAIIHLSNQWSEIGINESCSAQKLRGIIETDISDLSLKYATDMLEVKSFRESAAKKLSQSYEGDAFRVNSGLTQLDKETGGFRPGELVTVTAGTGVGKTLFAQQVRINACKEGVHTLYCTAEMTGEHLAGRDIATEAGVPHWKMRMKEALTDEDYKALMNTTAGMCNVCQILDGELSLKKIWSTAHLLKRTKGISCVIIDYDELVEAPGKNEFEQQRNLIRGSKALAMKLAIPVIMISQLRKPLEAKEAKKPVLERLYGSGAKSKHSSFVLFVDREYVRELRGDETKARICILKSRDGRIGQIPCSFNVTNLRFENALPEPEVPRKRKRGRDGNEEESET